MQQKLILEEQKEKQQAAAKAKKERMLQMEAEKKKYVPLTEGEQEDLMKANALKSRVFHSSWRIEHLTSLIGTRNFE